MPKLYPTPAGDSVQPIVDSINEVRRRQREAERPSGTNLNSLVAQVQAALANINATVAAAISANSYTKPVIDSLIANPPAGSNVTGNLTVSGNSTFGPIKSAYARAHTVLSGYANAYWDGNGDAGVNVSSVVYKQDIEPADLASEVAAILRMALVRFRYTAAVDEFGADAPVELGSLAEYVESIGLGEYVFYDAEGHVQGIAYERLTIPLIATVQSLDARLRVLEER